LSAHRVRCIIRSRKSTKKRRLAVLDPQDSQALARRIVDIVSDKQAEDVVMLDLREASIITDYFVLCSGTSDRQIKAITDEVVQTVSRENKQKPLRTEGKADSEWILLDYGSVVVHIFSPEMRDLYRLEKVWAKAVPVLRIA
jgi:ribosome-associated protein